MLRGEGHDERCGAADLDADAPAHRIVLTCCSYLFTSRRGDVPENGHALVRPRLHGRTLAIQVMCQLATGLLLGVAAGGLSRGDFDGRMALAACGTYNFLCVVLLRRRIVVWLIRLYQRRAPASVRLRCVLIPSCSNYMIMVIEKFGLRAGLRKGIDRLRRCGPPERIDF
jgi:putative component of membrane protein insertase Oxa1/YidC/SpoIIIJ protein YidD